MEGMTSTLIESFDVYANVSNPVSRHGLAFLFLLKGSIQTFGSQIDQIGALVGISIRRRSS